jgi:hypothetical protein
MSLKLVNNIQLSDPHSYAALRLESCLRQTTTLSPPSSGINLTGVLALRGLTVSDTPVE